ncbi:trypsin-like peptidase domain-containing protein [Modestobacter sp. URMC 112]
MPLATKTPTVGDDITVVGFRVAEGPAEEAAATPPQFVIRELLAAAGKVLAVHRPYRDAVMVPYPAIEIDCGAFGGMSGGVVLSQHGVVLGVISTSFGTDDDAGPTFAATVEAWHLDHELEIPWPPGAYRQPTTLRSLRDGLLRSLHGERN